ncbi:acyltransferase [Aquincola tertiaricarbonis]|uniref:Acyltransferase n=1 Tax=Aquincola tertiaricarbonis TaxID=391953 RepID=A0ABY4SIB1_AQUTE|nr:acyltransferase [Aquincola tertiaricarbonis]URI11060.1 acyltransferase [Aquincola tertiaricarbonis]
MNAQLSGVHAARGLAACLVVLHHAADTLALQKYGGYSIWGGFFIPFGRAGVDFFFVLSGFIMYWIHRTDIGQPDSLGRFAWKRAARIYPLYWLVLAALVAIYASRPALGQGHERDPAAILSGFLLFPADHPPIVGVAWTLSHELLFYGMFATLLVSRAVGTVVLGTWLLALVIARLFPPLQYPGSFLLHVKNIEFFFGIGVAIAARQVVGRPVALWSAFFLGALTFVGAGVLELRTHEFRHSSWTLLYGAGAALMLYAIVALERARLLEVTAPVLKLLGDASYAIYLVHFTVLVALIKAAAATGLLGALPIWVSFLTLAALATLIGCLVHRHVERPVGRLVELARRRASVRSA